MGVKLVLNTEYLLWWGCTPVLSWDEGRKPLLRITHSPQTVWRSLYIITSLLIEFDDKFFRVNSLRCPWTSSSPYQQTNQIKQPYFQNIGEQHQQINYKLNITISFATLTTTIWEL